MGNSATVGALRVVLGIDTAQFEDGLTKAQAQLKKVGGDMQRVGAQMQKIGLAIGTAVLAQAAAIGAAMMKVSSSIIDVADQAKIAGVEFEKFQALKYAAERNKIGIDALTDGLKELQIRADEFIKTGKGSGEEAFKRLGFTAGDLAKRLKDPSALFEEIISRLQRVDKAAQIRIADEIFGGSGGEKFVKFLDEGVDGIRRLKAEFAASGNLISAEDVEKAKALQDAISNLKDAIGNVARAFLRTGITEWLTDVATKLAQWTAKVVEAVPALAKWGAVLAVVGAALSVILVVVGTVVSAIGSIITSIGAFSAVAAGAGVTISGAFAALAAVWAPVAAAVAALVVAWLVVKDQVLPVLDVLKQRTSEVLGPAFAGLLEATKGALASLGAAFSALWAGPVGEGLRTAGAVIGGFAAILTRVFGEVGLAAVKIFVSVLTGAVNAIAIVIRALTAIFTGDWQGAWQAAADMVDNAVKTIISVFDAILPGIGGVLTSLYEHIRAVFVDGIATVFTWIGERASLIASVWGAAFGPAIQWAKTLYEGVKGWLVDRLGPMIQWVVDRINDLKTAFAFAVSAAQTGTTRSQPGLRKQQPDPTSPPPAPRHPDLSGGGSSKKPSGRSEAELAAQREALRLQAELDAAKARGDHDEIKRLEDIIDRRARIKAYQAAGLTIAAAQVAADRDRAVLTGARDEATRKATEKRQDELTLQIAQIDGDRKIIDLMEHKRDLAKLVAGYEGDGLKTAKATEQAKRDLLRIEDARLRTRQRLLAEARQEHAITLAQLSGNQKLARQLQDQREIEQRSRRYYTEGLYADPEQARGQASLEVGRESKARKYGENRDMFSSAFSDGIRAAMAGDLNGFLSNQFGTFMSEAFKRAGEQVFDKLFGGFDASVEGATQGAAIGATVTPAITLAGQAAALSMGTAIQLAGAQAAAAMASAVASSSAVSAGGGTISRLLSGLPKFAGGGTINPSGASGIDTQLVSFWKSPRESVSIGTPGQMAGGRSATNVFDLRGAVVTQDLLDQMNAIGAQSENRSVSRSATTVPGLTKSQTYKSQRYAAGRKQR